MFSVLREFIVVYHMIKQSYELKYYCELWKGLRREAECSVTNEQVDGENCQEERLLQLDLKFQVGGRERKGGLELRKYSFIFTTL